MRKFGLTVFLLMVVFAVSAQAQELTLSDSTINYGTLQEGPPIIKKVVLTNNGLQTLTIANVSTS